MRTTYSIEQTLHFAHWHASLRDLRGKFAIARRIDRAADGNLGDAKSIGEGLSALRIDVGGGYRISFIQRGNKITVLLAGGDKSSQRRDIHRARQIALEVRT